MENERLSDTRRLLHNYLRSPSLRHLRLPENIDSLARDILRAVDRAGSVWRKWDGNRAEIGKAAAPCWIPLRDLTEYLNGLPGPPLTETDVRQFLAQAAEDTFGQFPYEPRQPGCLALYTRERQAGTEMPAIIREIRDFLEQEEDREQRERTAAYEHYKVERAAELQARFLSGADCGWTPINGSAEVYCRKNNRAFRARRDAQKRWVVEQIAHLEDPGIRVGTYSNRIEANRVIAKLAYAPVPR